MTTPKQTPVSSGELMKHNWVQRTNSNGTVYLQIVGLLEDFAYVLKPDGRKVLTNYTRLEGVPLSPEILEKCGFTYSEPLTIWKMEGSHTIYEYDENDEDSVNHFIHFYHSGKNLIVESINDHGEYSNLMFKHIQYLHQLQNIYHSLTGSHLKVQL